MGNYEDKKYPSKSCFPKEPFKYYVIMFLTFLGPPIHLFDDLQYIGEGESNFDEKNV